MIADHEIEGKASTRVVLLVPVAVRALRLAKILGRTPRRQALGGPARDIGEERPGRLRRGRGTAAAGRRVPVGEDVLTEGTTWLLDRVEPRQCPADRRMVGRKPAGLESRDRGARAIEVIHAPAAEP